MDKLYVGDMNKEYRYVRNIGSNYIDLYNTNTLRYGNTYYYYRYYTDLNYYILYSTQYNSNTTTTLPSIELTDNIFSRKDIGDIFIVFYIWVIIIICCCNLVTSIIKKGGLLGGFFR